jgi:hypothetical protein
MSLTDCGRDSTDVNEPNCANAAAELDMSLLYKYIESSIFFRGAVQVSITRIEVVVVDDDDDIYGEEEDEEEEGGESSALISQGTEDDPTNTALAGDISCCCSSGIDDDDDDDGSESTLLAARRREEEEGSLAALLRQMARWCRRPSRKEHVNTLAMTKAMARYL